MESFKPPNTSEKLNKIPAFNTELVEPEKRAANLALFAA